MTIHRIARSVLQRTDQDAQVGIYGRGLRAIWDDWLGTSIARGMSTISLGARLQQAAEANYTAACLRGKRHAYPAAVLAPDDQQWVRRALATNRGYLDGLESAVQDKVHLQQMQGADLADLTRTFGSRVEQYGGALWRVTEAGYASGVHDLSAALGMRFGLPLRQEDDQPDDHDEEAALLALAALLRITATALRRLLGTGTMSDLQLADSAATQAVAASAGVLPETVATAATEALSGSSAASSIAPGDAFDVAAAGDEELATALGVTLADLLALGSQAARGGGIRMGTAYRSQNDAEVCIPCQSDAAGGEQADGVYWEPEDPPLPGDNCVIGETLVAVPGARMAWRRWHEGPVVRLSTAGSSTYGILTCTPNHPILTRRGWVAAGLLEIGDEVVRGALGEKARLVHPDVHNVPAAAQEMYNALADRFTAERMPVSDVDFHGDAAFGKGEVDVVRPDRQLRDDTGSSLTQPGREELLAGPDHGAVGLTAGGHLAGRLAGAGSPSRLVGGGRKALPSRRPEALHPQASGFARGANDAQVAEAGQDHALGHAHGRSDTGGTLACEVADAQLVRSASREIRDGRGLASAVGVNDAADAHARSKQPVADHPTIDPQFLRQCKLGYARDVALDEIVDIQVEAFAGHVYNFETDTGWYISNGIVTHNCRGGPNCRCFLEAIYEVGAAAA